MRLGRARDRGSIESRSRPPTPPVATTSTAGCATSAWLYGAIRWGRRSPAHPGSGRDLAPIALGSHSDTVPDGGRYDGALGVVAAVACARALVASPTRLRHPLEVLNFVSEEATMGSGTLGSSAMVRDVSVALDRIAWDGRPVTEHLRSAGVDLARIGEARRRPGVLAAYLELHIEQGATLWRSGERLGVVEGIVGIRRYQLEFLGEANHAGTTAMDDRRDALVMAAPLVAAVREIALESGIVGHGRHAAGRARGPQRGPGPGGDGVRAAQPGGGPGRPR